MKLPIDLIKLNRLEDNFFNAFFEDYDIKNKNLIKQKIKNKINKNKKINIGFFYCPAGHMSFPIREIFFTKNEKTQLFLYEFCCKGKCIGNNLNIANYNSIEFLGLKGIEKIYKDTFNVKNLVNYIKKDNIDVLCLIPSGLEGFSLYKLINELNDILVFHISAGSHFVPHKKIDIMANAQLPINYEIKEHKLIEVNTNKKIEDFFFVDDVFLYSDRGIKIDYKINMPKEPIIFIHSRLSKLVNKKYLWVISQILNKDKKRKFVFMGLEKEYLDGIIKTLKGFAVSLSQIEYLGNFNANANENGKFIDKGWDLCKKMLKESSIFCNDFPIGGGSSLLEAYLSGLPTVKYINKILVTDKIDILNHSFEVNTLEDYIELSDKLLNNEVELREKIVKKQYEIAYKLTSGEYFISNIYKTIKRYVEYENN